MRTIAGVAVVLAACGGANQGTDDTNGAVASAPDWRRVEASCGYSFEAPPELEAQCEDEAGQQDAVVAFGTIQFDP
jgi:hypothetical protein